MYYCHARESIFADFTSSNKWPFLPSAVLFFIQKYVAVGELGKATDTLDATGSVIQEKGFGKR